MVMSSVSNLDSIYTYMRQSRPNHVQMSVANDVLRVNNSFFSSVGPFVVTVSVIILFNVNQCRKKKESQA